MIQKAYNISIAGQTIDARENNLITWRVGGEVPSGFRIFIRRMSDSGILFDSERVHSYETEFELPSDSLTNGQEYQIYITVYGQTGGGVTSDSYGFRASSTPDITLIDFPSEMGFSSYLLEATYSQAEGVPASSISVILYDRFRVPLTDSGLMRVDPDENRIEYSLEDLKSEELYFVEVRATAENGLLGTTGLVQFTVEYNRPEVYLGLTAENYDYASIRLQWGVKQVVGTPLFNNVTYIDGEKADLRNNPVTFDDGFSTEDGFTLKAWIESPARNVTLIELVGEDGTFRLQYDRDDYFNLYRDKGRVQQRFTDGTITGDKFYIAVQQFDDGNINFTVENY